MPTRKRQISSTPEDASEDELSEVPSEQELGQEVDEDEEEIEEDDEEEEEVEEEEEQEEEDEEEEEDDDEDNVDEDADFEQQSEDEEAEIQSEEDESEEIPQQPITTSKGRVSRKPIPIMAPPTAPATSTRPARSSTRAEPPPEQPKIKLKLSLVKEPSKQQPMEEIKVENPPKMPKVIPSKAQVETKSLLTKATSEKSKGKQPDVVVDDVEDSESSAIEEDEEDVSDIEEDDVPGGTEVDIDEEDEEEEDVDTERSRTGTPLGISRLTKRQQAKYDDTLRPHALMSLPNETIRKKSLTADEIALRRSETARRRKNQSEQRLEEEKIETINRLLKPQAPRRKGAARNESPGASDTELIPREPTPPPPPTKLRIISSAKGTVVAVPERWMDLFVTKKGPGPRVVEDCGKCGKHGIYNVNGKRACSLGCFKALEASG